MPPGKSIVGDKVGRAKLWTSSANAPLAFYPIFDHLDFSAMIAEPPMTYFWIVCFAAGFLLVSRLS
jgi:hypothetical protein